MSDIDPMATAERATKGGRLAEVLPGFSVPILLVAEIILFSFLSPDLFFTWTNFRITLAAQATVLLLAIATTIPLRAGDFDLSLPAIMILCATATGLLYKHGTPAALCCLLAILIGAAVAMINALLIVGIGLDGLIVTLAMFTLLAGLNSYLSGGALITSVPPGLIKFPNDRLWSLSIVVWIGWGLAAITWFVFEFTPLGRYLLFLGGNGSAARLAGLRVGRLRFGSYMAAGTISAIAGVLLAGSLGSVDSTSAGSYLLAPLTAAFLGTTAIQIGRFNVLGTIVGLYLLAFGITGLQLLGIQGWVSDVFNGAALIVALTFARYLDLMKASRLRSRARRARDPGAPATQEELNS